MSFSFKTSRLQLKPLTHGDCHFIIQLLNTPGWLKYIGDRNVRTTEEAINYLDKGPIQSYEKLGYGLSLVQTLDTQESIGVCGLLKRAELNFPDLGFAFLPEFQGKGFAFEISQGTLAYARKKLQISEVGAITQADNHQSIKLLGKLGMQFEGNFSFKDSTEQLLLYKILL